jgi:ABC-type Na+ efflux pump permease subunit
VIDVLPPGLVDLAVSLAWKAGGVLLFMFLLAQIGKTNAAISRRPPDKLVWAFVLAVLVFLVYGWI